MADYLEAYNGISVGGVFFKEGDSVKVDGRLSFSDIPCKTEGFIIQLIPSRHQMFVGVDSGLMYMFNTSKITLMEHLKEEA